MFARSSARMLLRSGRSFGTHAAKTEAEIPSEVAKKYLEEKAAEIEQAAHHTITWKRISIFGIVPVLASMAYCVSSHHGHTDAPAMPYAHIRTKKFPWGECDLFDLKCQSGASH
mmetsp:Transcript_31546/g.50918  ORF Transcript_31546/g.50918 Transcript_31546/m.50918 type:complete len:114 (-) Transcript_31546:233-574(-)